VALRDRKGVAVAVVVGAAAVVVHLLMGTVAVRAAARWMSWAAIGSAVTFVVILHVVGLRRLVSRRRVLTDDSSRAGVRDQVLPDATRQHDHGNDDHHARPARPCSASSSRC
jgi:hypothetical protein